MYHNKGAERFQDKQYFITLSPIIFLQFGQSAMMVASWEGHLGIVEALISAEADPNLQDGVINIISDYNSLKLCMSLILAELEP